MRRSCPWPLLVVAGCLAPSADLDPAPRGPHVARDTTHAAPATLVMVRSDTHGTPLQLRAWVQRDTGFGFDGEALAVHDGRDPAVIAGLAPGRYKVLVLADPGPFGFDVVIGTDRAEVRVYVISDEQGHSVAVETRREPLGPGVTRVDRRILGFGWGPPLEAGDLRGSGVDAAELFRTAAERVDQALSETVATPAVIGSPRP